MKKIKFSIILKFFNQCVSKKTSQIFLYTLGVFTAFVLGGYVMDIYKESQEIEALQVKGKLGDGINRIKILDIVPMSIGESPLELHRRSDQAPNREIAPMLPGDFVFFADTAFEIRIPEWWKEGHDIQFIKEVYGFKNIERAFVNKEKSCALLYAGAPSEKYGQSRFINQVWIGAKQDSYKNTNTGILSATREILVKYAPQNTGTSTAPTQFNTFMGGGMHEAYIPYEFAVFYLRQRGEENNNFYLVSTDTPPLSEECESEARSILQTIMHNFEKTTLSESQDGILTISRDAFVSNSFFSLLFSPMSLSTVKKIFNISHGSGLFTFLPDKQVLYFLTIEDTVQRITKMSFLSDGSINNTEVANNLENLVVQKDVRIIDFMLDGSNIYYLTGSTGCREYKGSCSSNLYVYSMTHKNKAELIASSLPDSIIIGLSADKGEILMSKKFGDAGCWAASYNRVRFSDGDVISAGRFTGCAPEDGSKENTPDTRGQKELLSYFGGVGTEKFVNALMWQNGSVTPIREFGQYNDRMSAKVNTKFKIYSSKIRIIE